MIGLAWAPPPPKKRPVDRGLDHWQQPVAGVRCAAKTCRVGRLGFGSPHDVSIIILCLTVNSPGGCILILNCMNSTCVLFLFSSFFLHFRVHSLDFLLCLDIYNQLFLITFFFYRRLVSSYSLSLFSIRFLAPYLSIISFYLDLCLFTSNLSLIFSRALS
ncbi:hypothetical protein ASPTUDRAFT_825336 [Aspergillus tubingensis CBS 134.48]|uniref:Uncharacterized protein n=1 Tax=Aspergillus tubingensis (strain CBS 134.48) TaxID=767770 RepID=A0A1L9MWR5_ASPTC|nr:hypothetical protein ASPTUDRAFT_825336 [Aspergillus tubingensis CBS 134.48]